MFDLSSPLLVLWGARMLRHMTTTCREHVMAFMIMTLICPLVIPPICGNKVETEFVIKNLITNNL